MERRDLLTWYDTLLMRAWYIASFNLIISGFFSLIWDHQIVSGRIASNTLTEGMLVISVILFVISFVLLGLCVPVSFYLDRQQKLLKK